MWQHVKEARASGGVGPARPPESGARRSHFTGQPLNRELTDRSVRLVRAARTAPVYRLYVLAGTWPRKPGLVRVDGRAGAWLLCEAQAAAGADDILRYGGWRAYLASREKRDG